MKNIYTNVTIYTIITYDKLRFVNRKKNLGKFELFTK